jgi:hypothetical protein
VSPSTVPLDQRPLQVGLARIIGGQQRRTAVAAGGLAARAHQQPQASLDVEERLEPAVGDRHAGQGLQESQRVAITRHVEHLDDAAERDAGGKEEPVSRSAVLAIEWL